MPVFPKALADILFLLVWNPVNDYLEPLKKHLSMKKLTLALCLLGVSLASCTKQENTTINPGQAATYDITPQDWATTDNGLTYTATFDVPELDNAIFDHGAVLVYLSFEDGVYEALPEVYSGYSYGAYHSVGSVSVDFYAMDGSASDVPTADVYAKVVLISADQLALHPGVNLHDLGAVSKAFGIH